jgi:hypothetical protein
MFARTMQISPADYAILQRRLTGNTGSRFMLHAVCVACRRHCLTSSLQKPLDVGFKSFPGPLPNTHQQFTIDGVSRMCRRCRGEAHPFKKKSTSTGLKIIPGLASKIPIPSSLLEVAGVLENLEFLGATSAAACSWQSPRPAHRGHGHGHGCARGGVPTHALAFDSCSKPACGSPS